MSLSVQWGCMGRCLSLAGAGLSLTTFLNVSCDLDQAGKLAIMQVDGFFQKSHRARRRPVWVGFVGFGSGIAGAKATILSMTEPVGAITENKTAFVWVNTRLNRCDLHTVLELGGWENFTSPCRSGEGSVDKGRE